MIEVGGVMCGVDIQMCKDKGMSKCPRCFHWSYSINHDSLCNKCVAILCKHFPEHETTKFVMENLMLRGLSPEDNPVWNLV